MLIDGALDARQDFIGFGFKDEATLCKQIKENQLPKYLPIFNKVRYKQSCSVYIVLK